MCATISSQRIEIRHFIFVRRLYQLQGRLQQQTEQLRQDLESAHKVSSQQLQSRVTELEASCKELTERKYKNESVIRDLKIKLVGAEEVRGWNG